MAKDSLYTNGVIAVREKYLLKDRIFKLCELSADEAFRNITESGFGKNSDAASVYEYEQLVYADERAIDDFIREYTPSASEAAYLLAPRDFHNAKAIVKAHYLNLEVEKLLAPEGLVPVKLIKDCVTDGVYKPLGKFLGGAVAEAASCFGEDKSDVSGAEIGIIFEKAMYEHLAYVCAKNYVLKKLLAVKADMTNILTALRSASAEYAQKNYVSGGKLSAKQLSKLFDDDADRVEHSLDGTEYAVLLKKCLADRAAGLPLTQAERIYENYETEYFAKNKYELERSAAFLYYVFRRRNENSNVRILFACLLAGMPEQEIKNRLRIV